MCSPDTITKPWRDEVDRLNQIVASERRITAELRVRLKMARLDVTALEECLDKIRDLYLGIMQAGDEALRKDR